MQRQPQLRRPAVGGDKSALEAELGRLEESATYSAQSQFEQAKIWRGANLVLGAPAAGLAAVAGASGLADASNRTWAAVLALVSAALGAVLTSLNATSRSERAHTAANAYLGIQTEARQTRLLDSEALDPSDLRARVADLTVRLQEVHTNADIPARLAYRLGRKNIDEGQQTYEVDK